MRLNHGKQLKNMRWKHFIVVLQFLKESTLFNLRANYFVE